MQLSRSAELLKQLIAFPTVSRTSNLALIDFVSTLLANEGIESTIVHDESGTCANLFASTGPSDIPGIMLSGHTDVVPVAGQPWSTPAFEASVRDNRIYGRGAADMKGFVACAVIAMINASQHQLQQPLQLALSYDEEIGCVGVRRLLDVLELAPVKPQLCIIGEPTLMQIATGHKGKAAYRAICAGPEGHSALAPNYTNAIHVATDLVSGMRAAQRELAIGDTKDDGYDVPYSTIHVGTIHGGKALNIVPNQCTLEFEIRTLTADDPGVILQNILTQTKKVETAKASDTAPQRDKESPPHRLEIEKVNAYPGLESHVASDAVRFLESLLPDDTKKIKVAFGTEGGLFSSRLSIPALVCGPGSINVAHKPDEYVELAQLNACDAFLHALVQKLT